VAIYVTDVDAAVAYLRTQPGVRVLGEPQTIVKGPIAGTRWVYFLTPWGMQMELIHLPPGARLRQSHLLRELVVPCATAAVTRGIDEPFTLEDVWIDDPNPHEVLVRIPVMGMCHTYRPVRASRPYSFSAARLCWTTKASQSSLLLCGSVAVIPVRSRSW
jgi:hypothetical protein